jgi:hypothetical protein
MAPGLVDAVARWCRWFAYKVTILAERQVEASAEIGHPAQHQNDGSGARPHAQVVQDVFDVFLDRADADRENAGDVAVRFAAADPAENFRASARGVL